MNGRVGEAVGWLSKCVVWRQGHYPENHPSRLASQHELAEAYRADGQVKEAVKLLEQVVAIEAKVLAEDHPDRLISQQASKIVCTATCQRRGLKGIQCTMVNENDAVKADRET